MKKVKVVQVGIRHEHAAGKMDSLRKLTDIFDIAGVVDEKDFAKNATYLATEDLLVKPFEGIPRLSLEEALSLPGLEGVLIEVPNLDLVPVAMLFMEKGIPLHMDKPGCPDLKEFQKLLDGCKEKNLPFQMGYMYRVNPGLRKFKELYAAGVLGTLLELEMDMSHDYGGEIYQEYVATLPGGVMYNLGCHDFDFIVSLLGAPEKVTSFCKNACGKADGKALNNTMAVLEYKEAIVSVKVDALKGKGSAFRTLKAAGTNGIFTLTPVERIGGADNVATLDLKEARGGFEKGIHTISCGTLPDRYAEQLEEFAKMIRGEMADPYTREHDCLTHKVVLAAAGLLEYK